MHTGRYYEELSKGMDRDNYMTADEAKAFGLVDEVVVSRKEKGK
jgi:ATP-dependent Clp protease protease subunit